MEEERQRASERITEGRTRVRVLMLGWEFPPFITGGLGTACHGLTQAMERLDMEILFLLPAAVDGVESERIAKGAGAGSSGRTAAAAMQESPGVAVRAVPGNVPDPYRSGWTRSAYGSDAARPKARVRTVSGKSRSVRLMGTGATGGYDGNLTARVRQYAQRCADLVADEPFDAIHAHDWVTFPAGMLLAARSGKPLIVHVHATEFDRSGESPNLEVYAIEYQGMHRAAAVIAVSHLTERTIVERYHVPPHKVRVAHNGVAHNASTGAKPLRGGDEKTVLFLGRLTAQKGPEYFVEAAARVLSKLENVRFVIAGWGDLAPRVIEKVAAMGLGHKVFFAGFVQGRQLDLAYNTADVYVMPSVSEPFGLTALEAIQHGVPIIISKTSGVGEVINRGALRVDFWDTREMANKIIAVLKSPVLAEELRCNGRNEIRALTWDAAAQKCIEVYQEAIRQGGS
jgi:glycogen synthase